MPNNEQTQVDFGFDHAHFLEEEALLGRVKEGGYLAAVDWWAAHDRRTGRQDFLAMRTCKRDKTELTEVQVHGA